MPVQAVPPSALKKPVLTGIDPENMEPGMMINIRGTDMAKNPMVALTARDASWGSQIVQTTCVTKSDTWCQAVLPNDMYAGTYDIQVEGEHVGPWFSFSDGWGYNVPPGRYRIMFEHMTCVHPIHDLWDRDADLVTLWATVTDDSAWSNASSKYSDIGGGHPPVTYKSSDGNVFVTVPGNYEGFLDVRNGLVLVTNLYNWGGDQDAKNLAADVKTITNAAGAVIGIAFPVAGAALKTVGDVVATVIPIIAQLLGYDDAYTLAWAAVGPNRQYWTAPQLQQMAPGEIRPPQSTPPYTMKFGYGQWADDFRAAYGRDPSPYPSGVWDTYRIGDWTVTWRIQRAWTRSNN